MAEQIHFPEADDDETGPYSLIGTARAKPGCADQVEALILGLVPHIRSEEGALHFDVHRDRADRNTIIVYEVYRSLADLKRHITQPYTQQFIADVRDLVDGRLTQQFLRMSSDLPASRGGASTRSPL